MNELINHLIYNNFFYESVPSDRDYYFKNIKFHIKDGVTQNGTLIYLDDINIIEEVKLENVRWLMELISFFNQGFENYIFLFKFNKVVNSKYQAVIPFPIDYTFEKNNYFVPVYDLILTDKELYTFKYSHHQSTK